MVLLQFRRAEIRRRRKSTQLLSTAHTRLHPHPRPPPLLPTPPWASRPAARLYDWLCHRTPISKWLFLVGGVGLPDWTALHRSIATLVTGVSAGGTSCLDRMQIMMKLLEAGVKKVCFFFE